MTRSQQKSQPLKGQAHACDDQIPRHKESRAPGERINKKPALQSLTELRGWRVNVGTAGSGVPNLFTSLLDANHVADSQLTLTHLAETPATVDFLAGKLDAMVVDCVRDNLQACWSAAMRVRPNREDKPQTV